VINENGVKYLLGPFIISCLLLALLLPGCSQAPPQAKPPPGQNVTEPEPAYEIGTPPEDTTPPPESALSTPLSGSTTNTPPSESNPSNVYNMDNGSPIKDAIIKVEQYISPRPAPPPTPRPVPTPAPNPTSNPVSQDKDTLKAVSALALTPVLSLLNLSLHQDETRTDADGSYIIAGLPAGSYFVTATAERHNSLTKNVEVTDNISTTGIDFYLIEVCSISGHVYRADNKKPIAGAIISVYGNHLCTGPIQATTSADGSYTVSGLRACGSKVAAAAAGYVPRFYDGASGTYESDKSEAVITSSGENTPGIDIFLEWGGSVTGYVYMPDGVTPVNEAQILYRQVSGETTPRLGGCVPTPPWDSVWCNTSGNYNIGGLNTGEYELKARAKMGNEQYYLHNVVVSIGKETKSVDFVLGPGGSISGHVYMNDGITPAAGQYVQAAGIGISGATTTAADGSYSIKNLLPGKYIVFGVTVNVSGGEDTVHDIVLPPAAPRPEPTAPPPESPPSAPSETLSERFCKKYTITGDYDRVMSISAADIDGDGDMDVLGAAREANDITWWENDGNENFTEHTIKGDYNDASSVFAADVDSDGDIDVLGTAWSADDITWWENDGNENFTEHTIKGDYDGAYSVYAADVDSDGDIDVLGAAILADDITWWENDGSENFTEHTIKGDYDGARCVFAADVDGDGDMDVLGSAGAADDITWWENDGNENFTEHTIKGDYDGARSMFAADVDSDGDIDVLGAAFYADKITWWENDGNGDFTEHTIKDNYDGASSVHAADMDGDGDVDVLGTAESVNTITWWENDGSENFTEYTIQDDYGWAISVYASDVDNDGDMDILCAAWGDADIAWWENCQVSPEPTAP